MAELVDAHGSGPCSARSGGSSPLLGTIIPTANGINKISLLDSLCSPTFLAVGWLCAFPLVVFADPQAGSPKRETEADRNALRSEIASVRAVEQRAGTELRQPGPSGGRAGGKAPPPEGFHRHQPEFGAGVRQPSRKGDGSDPPSTA